MENLFVTQVTRLWVKVQQNYNRNFSNRCRTYCLPLKQNTKTYFTYRETNACSEWQFITRTAEGRQQLQGWQTDLIGVRLLLDHLLYEEFLCHNYKKCTGNSQIEAHSFKSLKQDIKAYITTIAQYDFTVVWGQEKEKIDTCCIVVCAYYSCDTAEQLIINMSTETITKMC